MTHDELLKKIDDEAMLGNKEWKAFRAVIELHNPVRTIYCNIYNNCFHRTYCNSGIPCV